MAVGRSYRRGDTGAAVAEIRGKLAALGLLPAMSGAAAAPDAVFDEACDTAVRQFQQQRQITVDGVVGPETYRILDEARWRLGDRLLALSVTRPLRGDDVGRLQLRLREMGFDCGRVDGIFGPDTDRALRDFQRHSGLDADGTCGPATFKALDQRAGGAGGAQQQAPEGIGRSAPVEAPGSGRVVVVDPGHGGSDRGGAGFGLDEAAVVEDLAARVVGRLTATGVNAFLTRGPDGELNDAARADFANATNADLLVSMHVDSSADPAASGVACFHYGHDRVGVHSPVGERFAVLLQGELVARTDFVDLGVWRKTWELLRRTRMPAVRVELGYLTNEKDARSLASAQLRDTVAEAIVVAVQQLFQPAQPESGQPGQPGLAGEPAGAIDPSSRSSATSTSSRQESAFFSSSRSRG